MSPTDTLRAEYQAARDTRNTAWDALRATNAAPGTPEHRKAWDALVGADAVLAYVSQRYTAAQRAHREQVERSALRIRNRAHHLAVARSALAESVAHLAQLSPDTSRQRRDQANAAVDQARATLAEVEAMTDAGPAPRHWSHDADTDHAAELADQRAENEARDRAVAERDYRLGDQQ